MRIRGTLLAALFALLPMAGGQMPAVPKNLQVLPRDTPTPAVVAQMRVFSASLGVKCGFCHVIGAFDKDDKIEKQVARRMMRMVLAINQQNFDGRAEVTCYTCHQGQTRPRSQVPARAENRRGQSQGAGRN